MTTISPASAGQTQNIYAMDKVPQEKLYLPGAYAIPPELLRLPRPQQEKKGGFLSFMGKLIATAIVVGGAAIGVRKGLMKEYKVLEKLAPDAKFTDKLKNTFAKYTDKLYDNVIICKNKVADFFKKEDAPKADDKKTTEAIAKADETTKTDAAAKPKTKAKKKTNKK